MRVVVPGAVIYHLLQPLDRLQGLFRGIVAGGVIITYTLPTGCYVTTPINVNPLPTIIGSTTICQGAPTTLTGSISGGTWVSSNTAAATIDLNSGLISAVALGNTYITYTLPAPTGCSVTEIVTGKNFSDPP